MSVGARGRQTAASRWMGWLGAGLLAIGLIGCGSAGSGDEASAVEVVALGERAYQANCASCHGTNGEGQPNWQSRRADGTLPAPPHDASGHTWHHPDEVLLEIIRRGGQAVYGGAGLKSGMPAFGGQLTDVEIEAVLAYIKSRWGKEERQYQEALPSP